MKSLHYGERYVATSTLLQCQCLQLFSIYELLIINEIIVKSVHEHQLKSSWILRKIEYILYLRKIQEAKARTELSETDFTRS